RAHSCRGARLARPGRDRSRADRRLARDLLERHAATAADRPHAGDAATSGVHGRADGWPRRVGPGAPARPRARPDGRPGPFRYHRPARFGGPPPARPSPARHARRRGGGVGADRPGARRSAASLHTAPRLLGPAAVTDPALVVEGLHKTFTLHKQGGIQLPVLHTLLLT